MSISVLAMLAAAQAAPAKPPAPPVYAPPPLVPYPTVSPPAPPAPPPTMEPARARANLAAYVSNDDYPAEALFNGEQGLVGFRLGVGPDGRVNICRITSSSGSASLDETTCRILQSRARFTPARDYQGRPTQDSVSARIHWRIVEDPPAEPGPPGEGAEQPQPAQRARPVTPLASLVTLADARLLSADPRTVGFELGVGADGRVTECVPSITGSAAVLDETTCRLMRERARFTPAVDAAGQPVADRHRGHIDWRQVPGPPPIMVSSTAPAAAQPPAPPPVRGLTPSRGVVPDAIRTHAAARIPLQNLISPDDYPAAALQGRDQGTARFLLTVGTDGRVIGCVILTSSGSAALDSATCRIMRSRASFTPARDAGGQPVEDRVWDQLAWRLPHG